MKAVKLVIEPSVKQTKRLKAVYTLEDGKTKTLHFGSPDAYTFYDGADGEKRENYIKRHRVNEDWNDIYSAGFLSRFVLWERPSDVIDILAERTGINKKDIKVKIPKNNKK